jgi:hypothetical protein
MYRRTFVRSRSTAKPPISSNHLEYHGRAYSSFLLTAARCSGREHWRQRVTSNATMNVGDSATKAGILSVTGTYSQNASGVLNISIGGTTVGSQYSQLAVSNGASLNGTLNIKLIKNFIPTIGSTFTIFDGQRRERNLCYRERLEDQLQ